MINKALIVGRLGKEPKNFGKGISFSVATDSGYGANKTTIWENVSVFGKHAETLEPLLKKGALVFVMGRREQQVKGDKTFQNIIADEVKLLEKKGAAPATDAAEDDDSIPL